MINLRKYDKMKNEEVVILDRELCNDFEESCMTIEEWKDEFYINGFIKTLIEQFEFRYLRIQEMKDYVQDILNDIE